ncbi:MAG: HK97 family phage prohead protease [Kiloniellaceae bacterium]
MDLDLEPAAAGRSGAARAALAPAWRGALEYPGADGRGDAPERLNVPFELKRVETRETGDGAKLGVFEGLASTFGNRDMAGDIIEPGAFKGSIAEPRRVKMLWQHDARAPIGTWEQIAETGSGLAVKGRLVLEVQRAREALALLKAGAVDALSIGFSVPRDGAVFDREKAVRRIKSVDLWEVSVVTFPVNPKARINRVKALLDAGGLPTEREFERFLMQDAGFSRSQARMILSAGYKAVLSRRDAGGGLDELVACIRRVTALMAASDAAGTRSAG